MLTYGGHHLGVVEFIRPMLEFRRKHSRYLIKNSYLRQDDMTPEERKSTIKRLNVGRILIKLPTGGK